MIQNTTAYHCVLISFSQSGSYLIYPRTWVSKFFIGQFSVGDLEWEHHLKFLFSPLVMDAELSSFLSSLGGYEMSGR